MKKTKVTPWLVFFLLTFLPLASIFGQGTISGKIIDKATGEEMIGANVLIKGTDNGASADINGKYILKADAGTYNLVVSYIGYPDTEIPDVVVVDGEVIYKDIVISDEEGGIKLEEIEVVGKVDKTSENALLVAMLKDDRVAEVMGSKEMKTLAISSADQAVAKQSGTAVKDGSIVVRGLGDRYSTAQLNGASIPSANPYKNAVNLDLIPTGLLDNIKISKTFTPDQRGTFTGGNVNLKTKSFPEQRKINVSLSAGYNTQASMIDNFLTHDGGGLDWLGYDDGYRKIAGIYTDPNYADALLKSAGSKAKRDDILATRLELLHDNILHDMEPTTKSSTLNQGLGISYADLYKVGGKDLGILFSANYSRNFTHFDNGALRNYALESPTSEKLNQNFNLAGSSSVESPTVGGMFGVSYKLNTFNVISFNSIYNHSADKSTRFYEGEYNTYQVTLPEVFQFRELYWLERSLWNNMLIGQHRFGKEGVQIDWIASTSAASQDEPELRYFGNEFDGEDYAIRAPSEYDYPNHFFRNLEDKQYEAKLDVTIPFLKKLGKGNKIKFGGLISQKDRVFSEGRYSVQRRFPENYVGDADAYFGDANGGWIGDEDDGDNIIGLYVVDDSRASDQYVGSEKIQAGYAMATIAPTEKLKVIAGARVENTELPVTNLDSTIVTKKFAILPSLNLVYALQEKMNLRASFSQTIARPNLRELAAFSNFDFRSGAFITGNPNLEITDITNIDVRWEWLFNSGELAAVSAYYKDFTNPIVLVNLGKSNPEFQYQNVDNALVYGVEFEFRKKLGFIADALKDFKWGTNLTFIHSEVDIEANELAVIQEYNPDAPNTRTFFNQSPFIINSNITYTNPKKGLDASLAYNLFGERLVVVGSDGTPDIFEQPRPQLDFTISKAITDDLRVRLTARNLLDPEFKESSTYRGNEFVYSNFRRGKIFSINISYTIK